MSHKREIDLTGNRYGKMVVLEAMEKKRISYKWKCVCDCGNVEIVRGDCFYRERPKSSCVACSKLNTAKRIREVQIRVLTDEEKDFINKNASFLSVNKIMKQLRISRDVIERYYDEQGFKRSTRKARMLPNKIYTSEYFDEHQHVNWII